MMMSAPLIKAFERAAGHTYAYHELFGAVLDDTLFDYGYKRYEVPNPELRDAAKELRVVYREALRTSDPFADLLGAVYMELSSRGQRQWMGQYFTPWPIASMMAHITMGYVVIPSDRLCRVYEPACGSGVMILAAMDQIRQARGLDALKRFSFTAADLDRTCARMTAVQIMENLLALETPVGELVVQRADTLRMEIYETVLHASYAGPDALRREASASPALGEQLPLDLAGVA